MHMHFIGIWGLNQICYLELPPAPPPPPFPEGYAPPTSEGDKAPEDQQSSEAQLTAADPIIDQGPSKRIKYQ